MSRTLWIRDLIVGQKVRLLVHIVSTELKRKSDGDPFLILTLGDRSGRISAIVWDTSDSERDLLIKLEFAEVCGGMEG